MAPPRSLPSSPFAAAAQEAGPSSLTFKELAHALDAHQHVAEGYDMQVLIRWGDPVVAGAPAFDPANLTGAAQEKQFGYNNDYLGLHPLPLGSEAATASCWSPTTNTSIRSLMFAGLRQARAKAAGRGRDGGGRRRGGRDRARGRCLEGGRATARFGRRI